MEHLLAVWGEELSPADPRWEEEVEHASVKLAEETMEWLSTGWGTGVTLFLAACWLCCAGCAAVY